MTTRSQEPEECVSIWEWEQAITVVSKQAAELNCLRTQVDALTKVLGECQRRFEFYGVDKRSQVMIHIREVLAPAGDASESKAGEGESK